MITLICYNAYATIIFESNHYCVMDYSTRLDISYYENVTPINEEHQIYLVKHRNSGQIAVKKTLSVYNPDIYNYLKDNPVSGIPKIYAINEDHNTLTVIEEYLPGETLESRLNNPAPFNDNEVYTILHSICRILSSLHFATPPIVHRDIKPSNIILSGDERVFLIDYNAAKYSDSSSESDTTLLGTKGFAAPEQYGFGSSTPRTDIYAIGIVLKRILEHTPSLIPRYERIAEKCSRIDPNDRYVSIKELDRALKYKPNLTPPGFRTKTPWHMIIAVPVYSLIFWFSFTLDYSNLAPASRPFLKLFTFLWLLGLILICCNYLDIHQKLPPCQHSNLFIRLLGVIIWCIVFSILILLFMCFVSIVFFNN